MDWNQWRAILLVTGCSVGAGMIGLPVVSALAGFIPTFFAMVACYAFAVITGLLLLEANLWFDRKINLISLAHFALGKAGGWLTWALFLFLFYCLFVAYIDGGGQLCAQLFSSLFGVHVSQSMGIVLCVGIVGGLVLLGTHTVAWTSRLFLVGVIASYIALVYYALPLVKGHQLLAMNWQQVPKTIPVLLICFGYQNLIPTLIDFAHRDVGVVRRAIVIGNFIPLVIYLVWNGVVLGLLPPLGEQELAQVVDRSGLVSSLLTQDGPSSHAFFFIQSFTYFALFTPFMTNAIAFGDFFQDGLGIQSSRYSRYFIYLLVLIPPMCLTLFYPHLFLKALGLAGGFADVLLFGILPAVVVWIGRYFKKMEGPYQVPGGRSLLLCVLVVSCGVLLLK